MKTENIKIPFLVIAILVVTCIAFSPSINNGFTNWDDPAYILENKLVTDSSTSITKFFNSVVCSNYHPLTVLSNALEYKIAGLNPRLYHINNLILHLLNTALVFWFIFLISGRKIEVAAIVSLFFGIHPMHVESVAWISERKDVLYTFFFISGLIAYYHYIHNEKNKLPLYLFILALFLLSLLSKAVAVTFPLVLILLDFYYKRKLNAKIILEKVPFLIAAVAIGMVAINAQASGKSFAQEGVFTLHQRIMFGSYGLLNYICKLFAPFNLSVFYPYTYLVYFNISTIYYLSPFIVLILSFFVFLSAKYTNVILFGALFYFLTISVVLQFVPVGSAIMADRYTYIPFIGLLFIIGMGYRHLQNQKGKTFLILKYLSIIILTFSAALFSYLSFNRCKIWKNSEVLWTDEINKHTPGVEFAYKNRSKYYVETKQFDLAIKDCNTFLSLKKDDSRAYLNRGLIYAMMADYQKAIPDYDSALSIEPGILNAYIHRGYAYLKLGAFKKAVEDYSEVIRQSPQDENAFLNRGKAHFSLKDYNAALTDYDEAIKLNPMNAEVYNDRGLAKVEKLDYSGALVEYNIALRLNPKLVEIYSNRGFCKAAMGDYSGSIEDLNTAISMRPDFAVAYNNRGFSKFKLKDSTGAKKDINYSISLMPGNSYAYRNLALIYLDEKNISEACNYLHHANALQFTKTYGNEVNELLSKHCIKTLQTARTKSPQPGIE